ncbi:hypothetical protein ZIOFF_013919 [Zingiber officinale]|uniref:Uncharacterized protein n=1 Tax=Zingiber officinale TaxID=94328 RepID=A0A8J5HSI2_ZINOF|nr:hypothetical protein ZIOFF_013919 [Zingiber officinale]
MDLSTAMWTAAVVGAVAVYWFHSSSFDPISRSLFPLLLFLFIPSICWPDEERPSSGGAGGGSSGDAVPRRAQAAVGAVRGRDQGPLEEGQGVAQNLRLGQGCRPGLRLRRSRVPWFQGQDQLSLAAAAAASPTPTPAFRCPPSARFPFCDDHHDPPSSSLQRPTSSSHSSTVEYFGRPRLPAPALATLSRRCVSQLEKKAKPLPQRIPDNDENCHSDCGSSASVVDDERDIASTYRHTLPFDLNLLPSPDDDIQSTILCF